MEHDMNLISNNIIVIYFLLLGLCSCSCAIVSSPLGTKAVLNCRVDGVPLDSTTVVIWMDPKGDALTQNDVTIKTGDQRVKIIKPYHTEFNLNINNVKMTDQGNYSCQAFKGPNRFYNSVVELKILVPPKAKSPQNRNISVVEGTEVVLECIGEGVPKPELDWIYHGKDPSMEETIAMEDTSRYVIKSIALKQSGHYECQANNNVPPISSVHFLIDVLSAPQIHVPYMKITQRVGNYIFLQCIVSWNPSGEIHWEHEGKKIPNLPETKKPGASSKYVHSMQKINTHSRSVGLFVYHFDVTDGGRYKCHASNKHGTTHGSIEVAAFHAIDSAEGSDDVSRVHAVLGDDVILRCDEKDQKSPVSWSKHTIAMKDFEVIPHLGSSVTSKPSKYQLIKERDLKITSINKLDQGYYMCSNKFNATTYLSIPESSEANTSCDGNVIRLPFVLAIIGALVFVMGLTFVVILMLLRSKYRRRFNMSGESILTGTHSTVACKL